MLLPGLLYLQGAGSEPSNLTGRVGAHPGWLQAFAHSSCMVCMAQPDLEVKD